MKRKTALSISILIIFTILIYSFNSYTNASILIRVKGLRTEKISNGYKIFCIAEHKNLMVNLFTNSTVPVSNERYIIHGKVPLKKIYERDFLYGQINYDINGNNNLNDVHYLRKKYGKWYFNFNQLDIIGKKTSNSFFEEIQYIKDGNTIRRNKISSMGMPFLVYNIDSKGKRIVLGLGTKKYPISLLNMPNPNIEITIMKPVDSVPQKINFSVSKGKQVKYYTNENISSDQGDNWLSCISSFQKLILKKGVTQYSITVKNIKAPFAIKAQANLSLGKGQRIVTKPVIFLVK